jgi:hypothetical protein
MMKDFLYEYNNNTFSSFEERNKHINKSQSLWNVNDSYYDNAEERFMTAPPAFLESVLDGGMGPLETAPVPNGLISFVTDLVKRFGIVPSNLVEPADVVSRFMSFLDYTEPYYLLAESAVELCPGMNVDNVFRMKKSKTVLPPDKVECFKVNAGFDFPKYKIAEQLLNHPSAQAVLDGKYIRHSKRGDAVTKLDIIRSVCDAVWGNSHFIECFVDDWIYSHYESGDLPQSPPDNGRSDALFWYVIAIGCLVWFKSPFALKYLIDYHPVYYAVLGWNHDKGHPYVRDGSDGLAVVYGWEIYTMEHLIVETDVRGGSCAVCRQSLHCTKVVNSWAVVDPICSCGRPYKIDVEDEHEIRYGRDGHHLGECEPYKMAHPGFPRVDFICMHCLYNKMNKLPDEMKCGRRECPNVRCVHHLGSSAYVRGLTENRRMLIAHKTV